MEYKEMKIDVAIMAKQALQEGCPAAQLDAALLRAAKEHYGASGSVVFQAIRAALVAIAKRKKVGADEALQEMMRQQRSIRLVMYAQRSDAGEAGDSPDDLK